MALYRRICTTGCSRVLNFHFSTSSFISNKWRREQGLEPNPRSYGPLTQKLDYSFVDGRPTILSESKLGRIKRQGDICKRICELTHELDVGLDNYNAKMEQERINRENILKNKLKPKGAALLLKNKNSTEDL